MDASRPPASFRPDGSRHLGRREWLTRCGMGIGMVGLAHLLDQDGGLGQAHAADAGAGGGSSPMAPKAPHFPGKAKHLIHIFANGGPSQVDTFDPKPELKKWEGKSLPMDNLKTERRTGNAFPSAFKFEKYGQSGIEVSELFANTARHIDDMAIIRSMHADVPNHEPSFLLMNNGDARLSRPCFGSWLTYGLGTENQNLPGYVVLCPGGYPTAGAPNWQSAFLPGVYQGTHVDTRQSDIEKLIENVRCKHLSPDQQRRQLDLVQKLNRDHQAARSVDPRLEARIETFELAYRMQGEAAEAFDISRETPETRERYGNSPAAKSLLITKRLIERGVRVVQVYHGQGQPWDHHDDIIPGHKRLAGETDRAIAALMDDLKALGLFDETLIVWGGEFGRTPVVELPTPGSNQGKVNGRDHNHWGFSMWMAGGGVKGGQVYGATDEFGFKAIEKPVHVHDLHATMLALMGFDHTRLTYRFSGRDFRLTDVHGTVLKDLIT